MVRPTRAPGALHPAGVVAVTFLTVLAVWASVVAGRWSPVFAEPELKEPPPPSPEPTLELEDVEVLPQDYGLNMRDLVALLLTVMAIVALVRGIGWITKAVRAFFHSRLQRSGQDADGAYVTGMRGPELAMPDVVELREGIAEAWARLAEHRDPSDAIQAAWVALEDAAGRSGVPRGEADTPTEFTVAVLDRTAVDPSAIRTLLGLYHRARFSTHGATAADVETAGRCLSTLAQGLEA